MAAQEKPFFIGWSSKVPRSLLRFLLVVAAVFILGGAAIGFGIGVAAPDPGSGDYTFPEVTLTGVIEAKPQPILRLAPDSTRKTAHAMLLSTEGTNGASDTVADWDGKTAEIRGLLIKRGEIDMLEIAEIKSAAMPARSLAPPVPLGRWRITGEICDGKCYAGAMRPGGGISHKACAGICFVGGVPAIFVSTRPIEGGGSFLLLIDRVTGTFVPAFRDLAALRIAIEGEVERIDDLLIFRVDAATAKVL